MTLTIPRLSLVVLIGPSGSGKSTFSKRHFRPTEVVSSDECRALVSDDPNNQVATDDAFEVLHLIVRKRLARGRLTVVDATSVRPGPRGQLVRLAREHDVPAIAVVFDLPETVIPERNRQRTDRQIEPAVVARQRAQLHRSMADLEQEGFRHVVTVSSEDDIEAVTVRRESMPPDRRGDRGPFDIIGDVHGCADELETLLDRLGFEPSAPSPDPIWPGPIYTHPEGRRAVFLGDLVDRGPRSLDSVRIARNMVAAGSALCVPGNHDDKLLRKLRGRNVRVAHGLERTLAEFDALPDADRGTVCEAVAEFLDGLVSHYVLDGGRLVVAHAGMKKAMQGRDSRRVRDFALYGETTGEVDEFGLPVRLDWAARYRGRALVVYGHTPVPDPAWSRNAVNIDTGCVFGGMLSALRYPEREIVSVPAARVYCEPKRPFKVARSERQESSASREK